MHAEQLDKRQQHLLAQFGRLTEDQQATISRLVEKLAEGQEAASPNVIKFPIQTAAP